MYIKLKEEVTINHDRTQDFVRKCIGRTEPLKFDWDKGYILYRMILASFSHERFQKNNKDTLHINDDIDLVKFYILDKDIDLLNSSGMDSLVDAFNSDNREESFRNLSNKLNEDFENYFNDEKRDEFLIRFLVKLLAEDNSIELDNSGNLSDVAILEINGCTISAIPGLKRIAKWINI